MVMDMFILFKNRRLLLCENTSSLWIQRQYWFEVYLLCFIIIIIFLNKLEKEKSTFS